MYAVIVFKVRLSRKVGVKVAAFLTFQVWRFHRNYA